MLFYYFSNNCHFYLLSSAAHLNLGIVLSDMGHFEKAVKVWNIFITGSVSNGWGINFMDEYGSKFCQKNNNYCLIIIIK